VPKGWKAYATHASDKGIDRLYEMTELARERAGCTAITMLVYGTGDKVRTLCGERDWIFIEDAANNSRREE
jgi:hypothetical protein